MDGAVFKSANFRPGKIIAGIKPVKNTAGDKTVTTNAKALARFQVFAFFTPVGHLCDFQERFFKTAAGNRGNAGDFIAALHRVHVTDVDRVNAEFFGRHIHLGFGDKQCLGGAETAHCPRRRFVGINMGAVVAVVGIVIEHGAKVTA